MTQVTKTRLLVLTTVALLLAPLLSIEPRTYLTLSVAGLAMGMLIFLVASGLTLIASTGRRAGRSAPTC